MSDMRDDEIQSQESLDRGVTQKIAWIREQAKKYGPLPNAFPDPDDEEPSPLDDA